MSTARPYRSELRARQTEGTRSAILRVTLDRFSESGYAATTISEIAQSAGVSAQTVYAHFGSKAGLMHALIEFTNARSGASVMARDVIAAPTPADMLRASVHLVCVLHERIGGFIRVLLEAAQADPSLAPALEAGRASHRGPQQMLAHRLHAAGALREELTVAVAADLLTEWTSPETIGRYVALLDWSYDDIETILSRAVAHALCRPGTEDLAWPTGQATPAG